MLHVFLPLHMSVASIIEHFQNSLGYMQQVCSKSGPTSTIIFAKVTLHWKRFWCHKSS